MRAYLGLLDFAAGYGMIKCLKTMLVGAVCMGAVLALRRRDRDAGRNLYALLLLFPAVFTGMSKLFSLRGTVRIAALLNAYVQPVHGKLYFAVCGILLFRLLRRRLQMRRFLRGLPVAKDRTLLLEGIDCVTSADWLALQRWYLSRVRLYISEDGISPFSGGILHPYVVMPKGVLEGWRREQQRLVLCHELIHIRSGHVLWLTLFQLLKIYWWVNPAVYLCDRLLRSDMELVCDEQCAAYTGVSAADYGRAMLNMLGVMQAGGLAGSPAFIGREDGKAAFEELRRRLEHLARTKSAGEVLRRHRRQSACFAAAAALLLLAVSVTSYPRYTKMKELVLYDEQLNVVDYDSEALRGAAQVRDGRLILEKEKFERLMAERAVQGEYVYLSFDTILKVPGCGGGGNVGMISLADCEDIFYLAADCAENRIMVFCLKYLM